MTQVPAEPLTADVAVGAFVQRIERAERRSRRAHAIAAIGLPCAAAVAAVLWWSLAAACVAAAVATAAVLVRGATVDVRRARRDGLLRLDTGGPRLRDELLAWDEARQASVRRPMLDWLEGDLAAVPAIDRPAEVPASLPRRRLGRVRYFLPLALALLLLWLALPTLPLPGLGGGGAGGRGQGGTSGGGANPAPAAAADVDAPLPSPPAASPPPVPPEDPPAAPSEPEPPAPLLDLPSQRHLVVPEFTGDGPTRRELAERALVGADAAAAAGAAGGRAPAAETPPPSADEFRRAAERALADRHVPVGERPIVRRFFELLQAAPAGDGGRR